MIPDIYLQLFRAAAFLVFLALTINGFYKLRKFAYGDSTGYLIFLVAMTLITFWSFASRNLFDLQGDLQLANDRLLVLSDTVAILVFVFIQLRYWKDRK